MAIRNTKQLPDYKGHCLRVGECFKFGRVKYLVKDISLGPINGDELNPSAFARRQAGREKVKPKEFPEDDGNADEESKCESPQLQLDSQARACRICLMEGSEWDSPLIAPCECCGTMKYVHVKCLAHWLQSRIKSRTTGAVTSVVWKALDCELCKKSLSEKCESGGKTYDLVTFPKPNQGPYITLELMTKEKTNQTRGILILNLAEKNQMRLGRGHDCDVRIHDISVSRCHATITYNKNGIFLEDKNSKFGSLVLIQNPTRLSEDLNGLTLQIGRSVFEVHVEKDKKWGLMFSCFNTHTVSIERLEREELNDKGQDVSIKRQTSNGPSGPFGPLIPYNTSPQPGPNQNHPPQGVDSGSPRNLRADEDFDMIPDENNDVHQNIRADNS